MQPLLRGRRVLVVDDNATNRRIVTTHLGNWGLPARATESPREALRWIQAGERFDLAILDMHMPEMDGVALARAIRQEPAGAALPLVLFTSLGRREARAESEGFAAYLHKPIKPSQLFDALAPSWATSRFTCRSAASGGANSIQASRPSPAPDPPGRGQCRQPEGGASDPGAARLSGRCRRQRARGHRRRGAVRPTMSSSWTCRCRSSTVSRPPARSTGAGRGRAPPADRRHDRQRHAGRPGAVRRRRAWTTTSRSRSGSRSWWPRSGAAGGAWSDGRQPGGGAPRSRRAGDASRRRGRRRVGDRAHRRTAEARRDRPDGGRPARRRHGRRLRRRADRHVRRGRPRPDRHAPTRPRPRRTSTPSAGRPIRSSPPARASAPSPLAALARELEARPAAGSLQGAGGRLDQLADVYERVTQPLEELRRDLPA